MHNKSLYQRDILIPKPSFLLKKFRSFAAKRDINQDILKNISLNFNLEIKSSSKKTTEGNRGNNYILHTSKGNKLLKFYKRTLNQSTIKKFCEAWVLHIYGSCHCRVGSWIHFVK